MRCEVVIPSKVSSEKVSTELQKREIIYYYLARKISTESWGKSQNVAVEEERVGKKQR